jgi:hypothetical protein
LLFQGSNNSHNPFNKAATLFALSAKTGIAPEDTGTNLPFSQIVSGFNVWNPDEGSQGSLPFENVAASASGFGMVTGEAQAE